MIGLPSQFVAKVTPLQNYRKAPIRILPTTGQGAVKSSGYIKFALPVGCVLDLKTLAIHFDAKTLVDNADPDASATATDRRIVGFPKHIGVIDTFEVWVNGRNVQSIPQYSRIYSLLRDFKNGYNSQVKRLGTNADPSVYTTMGANGAIDVTPTKFATDIAAVNGSRGSYVWNNFIGFLDSQPSIIDTNILGQVEIHIKLLNGNCLWGATNTGGDLPAGEAPDFELTNIVAYCDKIDFKDEMYYSAIKSLLETEKGFKIVYKNYMYYTGNALTNNKNSTVKITENCSSLDKIIFTFYDNTAPGGKKPLQLTNNEAFVTQLAASRPVLLNDSIYMSRNGIGVNTVQFEINSQDITPPMTVLEQWQQTLQAFELNEDDSKQINPAIKDLNYFKRDFYCCAFSTSHINNKDTELGTLLSGISTEATSMNITVKSLQDPNVANNNAQAAIPVIITEFTSMLLVSGARNIMTVR